MTSRSFNISREDFSKKKKTIIQHKIRTLLKCYTVQEFNLDESEKKFTFKKTIKINGLQMVYPKTLSGTYSTEDNNEDINYLKLTLSV